METEAEKIFFDKRKKENFSKDRIIDELYKDIGQRGIEIAWLKKNSVLSYRERSALIDKNNSQINLSRQAKLLNISRSSIYYHTRASQREIEIKNAIDKICTDCPFYGSRRIKKELEKYSTWYYHAGANS